MTAAQPTPWASRRWLTTTAAQRAEVVRMYVQKQDLGIRPVAARAGLSYSTTWNILRAAGVTRSRESVLSPQRRGEAVRLYTQERMRVAEVAAQLGVPYGVVWRVVTRRHAQRPSQRRAI